MSRWFVVAFAVLVAVRLPTLAEPSGADQDLYLYVGQRILAGEIPYRDAWDQKPPGIHYTYAALQAIWPHPQVVSAADLVAAVAAALGLLWLGRRVAGRPGGGEAAALLFLLLGHPGLTRLGGVRVRSQSEVFIGLAVLAALLILATGGRSAPHNGPGPGGSRVWRLVAAGACVGVAFLYKYNAGVYLIVALAAAWSWRPASATRPWTSRTRDGVYITSGLLIPVAGLLAGFWSADALSDLYEASVRYNLEYSGETYQGPFDFTRYLLTFPVLHARIDPIWFVGGLGSAVMLHLARRDVRLVPIVVWVAAACASIAVNGSRGLPQYFVQAQPALALAAGVAAAAVWPGLRAPWRWALVVLVAIGAWRVGTFPKIADYLVHDVRYLSGAIDRSTYLQRFGEPESDAKFSAVAVADLAHYLRTTTSDDESVLVFGFSPGALVQAERRSATRFFWSRPVIVGFNDGQPGYGASGLLSELRARHPQAVILQRRDWDPDTIDSASYFLGQPELAGWLRAGYRPDGSLGNFLLWQRTGR